MQELDDSKTTSPDLLGFVGLAFAVVGISTAPSALRIACLVAASVCLPASFLLQTEWPRSTRWVLSVLTDGFFGYLAWNILFVH